jgi:hypothetical protein
MMLLVAITWPFDGPEIVVAVDSELTEVDELVLGKVDAWLARGGAPGRAMLPILSIRSIAEGGPVFIRRSEALAITRSPFEGCRWWWGRQAGGVTVWTATRGRQFCNRGFRAGRVGRMQNGRAMRGVRLILAAVDVDAVAGFDEAG